MEGNGKEKKIGYLGPPGSFTHQASLTYIHRAQSTFPPPSTTDTARGSPKDKDGTTAAAAESVPLSTIAAVFHAVAQGKVEVGVVPVENSTNGAVYPTLDLFAGQVTRVSPSSITLLNTSEEKSGNGKQSREDEEVEEDVVAVGEVFVRVEHCLVAHEQSMTSFMETEKLSTGEEGKKRDWSTITSIHTHPQAWTQCSHFLSTLPAHIEKHDSSSTSRAAELAALDSSGSTAAISSRITADIYTGLQILEQGIQNRGDNVTRFLVLRRRGGDLPSSILDAHDDNVITNDKPKTRDQTQENTQKATTETKQKQIKSLIAFTIAHTQPGSLAQALSTFNKAGLNLSSINTRPSGTEAWGYVFFVEVLSSLSSALTNTLTNTATASATTTGETDATGKSSELLLTKAIKELEGVTLLCRWLGSWESGEVPLSS